jgi:hypothetical protein
MSICMPDHKNPRRKDEKGRGAPDPICRAAGAGLPDNAWRSSDHKAYDMPGIDVRGAQA